MSVLSCALGLRDAKLSSEARAFFKDAQPWAFILFREACVSKPQVAALCADLRETLGREALIWIDQEGGRVARLKPPVWPVWPAAATYGEIYTKDPTAALEAAWLGHRLIANELKAMGVNGDFAPVLDVPWPGSDKIVGDRAFSATPEVAAQLARRALDGLHCGGVAGAIKHAPGHGRALVDSHVGLPRVGASDAELEHDLTPFKALADAEAAMTAHIVYEVWDGERPATCSSVVIESIIRARIGFQGLLLSDDLDMNALQSAIKGGLKQRAQAALEAGCDVVLQCSGVLKEMKAVAEGAGQLAGPGLARARAVEEIARSAPESFDEEAGWARFKELVAIT